MTHTRSRPGWRWVPAAVVVAAGLLLPVPAAQATTPTDTPHHLTDPTARTPRTAAPLVDPGSGFPVRGVDTSHFQHPNDAAIDWGAVAAGGRSFAFLKATEGTTFTDPWFARDLAGAAAAGIYRAPYHFLSPGDPVAQADFFMRTIEAAGYTGHGAGELPAAIDVEWNTDGTCPAFTAADVLNFASVVQVDTARTPVLYAQQSFVNTCLGGSTALGGLLLWTVDVSQSPPRVAPGFATWTFWQYGMETVTGVPTAADVDAFNGTASELAGLANLGHVASLSGDGKAEFVNFQADGVIIGWLNTKGFTTFPWSAAWVPVGSGFTDSSRLRFADLDGDGKTELIYVQPDGQVRAWHNVENGGFVGYPWAPDSVIIASGFADPTRARFPDLDGDGRADVAYVQAGGTVEAWHNVGGYAPFPWGGTSVVLATGFTTPSRVTFTDLDSDGRAEALYVQASGAVTAWHNVTGFASLPWDGTPVTIATGFSDPARARFPDLDGDGRADAAYLQGDGTMQAWHNVKGFAAFPWGGGAAVTVASGFSTPASVGFA
jgi:GH25 family lysozyme M1 (1,4-beta-N-acetylmuramidase)